MGRSKRLIIFYLCIIVAPASASTMQKTKTQLAHLKEQITSLNQKLFHAVSKQSSLETQLVKTDKKIGGIVHQLNLVSQVIQRKKAKSDRLAIEIEQLKQAREESQTLLAQHVRVQYIFGMRQLSKKRWFAQTPGELNRWMAQYQHLLQARIALIDDIASKEVLLIEKEAGLKKELLIQAHLKQVLEKEKQTLEKVQGEQSQIVEQLKAAIDSDKHKLTDYQRNEKALGRLLETLLAQAQSTSYPQGPVGRKKTVKIGAAQKGQGRKWHQGIIFKAPAGSGVYAAESGKVVFSDWLRGYGLMMIIDHGKGWMSLYGYNQSLFKRTGEWVVKGEQIATVGSSGGQKDNALYFEVRHFGKVSSAHAWLNVNHRNSPIFIT